MFKSFRTRVVLITAVTALSLPVRVSFAGSVSAAKSRVMQAQDYAEHNRKDDAKDKLDEAEKFLDGLTDAEKAPIQKDIAALREKLGAAKPTGAKTPPPTGNTTPAPAANAEMADRVARSIERTLKFAQDETNPSALENQLEIAQHQLESDDAKQNLSADAMKKYQGQVDAIKAKSNSQKMSEDARRLTDEIERHISAATGRGGGGSDFIANRLNDAHRLLDSDEAKQKLDAATVKRLRQSIADAEMKVAGDSKKDAIDRATPILTELEEKVAADPFKGLAQYDAYKVSSGLSSLIVRANSQLQKLPPEDADRKALEARLTAASKKIDGYDAAWASANVEAAILNRWQFAIKACEGWEAEANGVGARPFEKPKLEKTERAAREATYFLGQKETADARAKGKDLPKAAETIAAAEKVLADAQAKLHAAFEQWMTAAEKQPRPQGQTRFDIGAANDMAHWADDHLAGSKYHDADVARAKKLDQRWKDEIAAMERQYKDALAKLSANADAAWPKIASSISASEGFHPADAASLKGKTFLFKGVRNRSGWDFDGQYDIVMWVDDQPVAGHYAPKIKEAFSEASRQIGDSVPDHIDWDVIAVVEGTGTANRRYTTEVKDEHMNVLGKIEGTRPMPCVLVRVIAVHAGPVAVADK